MPNITRSPHEDWNAKTIINQKFLFVENALNLKRIRNLDQIKLCVIKSDFDKNELKLIKKVKSSFPDTHFWISTTNATRQNVMLANDAGITTIISYPVDEKVIEDFFKRQDINYLKENLISQNQDYSNIAGLKVMIVDDNIMNVELLEEVLSKLDLKISSFVKPKMAYEMLLHEKFDLFLLDIMMPEMSGFDLAKKIKETPHNKYTPVVFISALSDAENKITGYDLGSHAYIEKPFDVNIIKSQIYNILKNVKSQEVLASDKESFLATVAHDLKTPIRAKINALNILLDENFGMSDSDKQEIIEDILNSTKFMEDMVENLLCKNKIEGSDINLLKQVCSLEELARDCIDLTKYILSAKKQKIVFKCRTKNTLIPIDYLEMKRALHNLIANASQYSPNGGDVIVEIFNHEDKLGISVQDFGRGIALEHQKDIFLQYMSFAKKHKTVGSGLGLYITKRIAEAHNGEVLLDSKIGYGTKISILLPIYTKV